MYRLADILAVYISLSYVVAVHSISKDVNEHKIRRDDPRVIKARMKAVLSLTIFHLATVPMILAYINGDRFETNLLRLGIIPGFLNDSESGLPVWTPKTYIIDILQHASLAIVLYTSLLLDSLLHYLLMPEHSWKGVFTDIASEICSIWGLRDYIFGPITEELFYTSMVLMIYLRVGDTHVYDASYLRFVVPNLFGIAHLHHAFEQYSLGLMNLMSIIFVTMLQMSYTWLFGSFTNHLFLNSAGNLWSCILIHGFCNYMGLPQGNAFSKAYELLPSSKKSSVGTLIAALWKYLYFPILLMSVLLFKNNFGLLKSHAYEPLA